MSSFSITEPSKRQKWTAGILVVGYALITIMPLVWILMTGFKSPADAISYPPKVVFEPTLEGYVNLFTTRTRQTEEFLANNPPQTWARPTCTPYPRRARRSPRRPASACAFVLALVTSSPSPPLSLSLAFLLAVSSSECCDWCHRNLLYRRNLL